MEITNLYEDSNKTSYKYAGFTVRAVAYLVDGLILSILMKVLFLATSHSYSIISPGNFIALLITITYFVYFETGTYQATLGKRLMGIKVIKQDGTRLSVFDAILRYFAKLLSAFIAFIGFIMVIFDDKKRGLHDRIANTYVVNND